MTLAELIQKIRNEIEKPIPNDLEEAAVDIADSLLAKPKDYALSAKADYWNGAHDGVIAGAKWQEEQDLKYISEIHRNGYNLCKEQILKEAVDGTVYGNGDYTWVAGDIPSQFKYGDKVRIIVCKKED